MANSVQFKILFLPMLIEIKLTRCKLRNQVLMNHDSILLINNFFTLELYYLIYHSLDLGAVGGAALKL